MSQFDWKVNKIFKSCDLKVKKYVMYQNILESHGLKYVMWNVKELVLNIESVILF